MNMSLPRKEDEIMAIKRDIVCKCGNLLGSTTNTSGGGEKVCSVCKKRVKYSCSANGVYTAYKN